VHASLCSMQSMSDCAIHVRGSISIYAVAQFKSIVVCPHCNYESARFEPFSVLQACAKSTWLKQCTDNLFAATATRGRAPHHFGACDGTGTL
jgi:ubiquitin C-terminal hydrolase